MPFPKAISTVRFRTKVLVPVVVCMGVLITVTFLVVNYRIEQQFQSEAQHALATANTVFLNLQRMRMTDLRTRFRNIPNEPRLRVIFQNGDQPTMRDSLRRLMDEQKMDAVFYTDAAGKNFICEEADQTVPAAEFQSAATPAVRKASQNTETVDTVRLDDRIYEIVAVPVYDAEHIQYGTLAFATELGESAAQEFRNVAQSEFVLLVGGRVIASTLRGTDISAKCVELFNRSPSEQSMEVSDLRKVELNGIHYFGVAGRFQSLNGDRSLGYVFLTSYEPQLNALYVTQKVLLGVSLCAIAIGALIIWLLVKRVTQPLQELRDTAEAVGRGDFTRRVTVRSHDECGELALVFNQMTGNLEQSRAQLEQTVTTLKTTQEQLIQSEKLSAVGEFVAGVAHELNNPLAAVMGFSELLQNADVGEKNQRHLNMIFKSAQRCQKIVQSLLSFARRHKPERKPASVNALIDAVLEIVAYPLRTSNIEVKTTLHAELPAVMADEHQIQQVLLNIVNNARQAIEAHQPSGKINISTEASNGRVRIIIQDNGPGISPENLRKIFNPFFTTKEVGKGTGLGLSLCYGIVQEHGGEIKASSRPGEGSTFIIELPAADVQAEEPAQPPAEKIDPREGIGKKVLVVDDEEGVLQMIHESLCRYGYHVDTLGDGETALRRLEESDYDAVLCDWKMPGINGKQLYERLLELNPDLCRKFIFITGDVVNDRMREFLKLEKRPYLSKPFALTELHAMVKSVVTDNYTILW